MAIAIGKKTGIFETWEECQKLTSGVKGAKYQSFTTKKEAEEYLKKELGSEYNGKDEIKLLV